MAEWSKNKVDPSNLHGGQEFVKGDNLAVDELNAIVNNSFYASGKSERAEQLAESAVKGNGTLVTIGGQIQGEWSADFAESERQKSKNLFYLNVDKRGNSVGVEYVFDKTNQAFLIHGTSTGYGSINTKHMEPVINYLKAGKTYTLSTHYARGFMSLSGYSVLYLATSDGNKTITFDGVPRSITYTPTVDTYISGVLLDLAQGNTYNDIVCQIQVEEGEVATEWQHPYGATVHKEDIANYDKLELFYHKEKLNVLGGLEYGGGLPISFSVTDERLSKYKALIIKSSRRSTRMICRLLIEDDYNNSTSNISLDVDGNYLIIHNFYVSKSHNTFNFNAGGYKYINTEDVFHYEDSSSSNVINEIWGVLK